MANAIATASAVHPDSKVACLVKVQIKAGSSTTLNAPMVTSPVKLMYKEGAIKYSARFLYRPASLLVALSLMPDPSPAALGDAGVNAQAGPSSNKRKHGAHESADAGAHAGGAENEAQRKKRLTNELLAIKEELGEEAVIGALLKPKDNANQENAPVKKEQGGGQNSAGAIDVDAGPKNQRIFLDLSVDDSDEEA